MARSKASTSTSRSTSRASARSSGPAPEFVGTFYPADVDGAPAAFVVDLEQEPRPTHPTRITVSLAMHDPEPDGLRSETEMEELDAVQGKISERLARAAAADCVGFYDLRGVATFVYYGSKQVTTAQAVAAVGDVSPYEADVQVDDDPEWRFYIDALFPDAYALQGIWNRLICDELESHGDSLDEPRDVDHVATFDSYATAQTAAKRLQEKHFTIDSIGDADEAGRFAVAFHRSETLEMGKPDQFSAEILDIVLALDGEYDGWGAPAAAPEKKSSKAASKAKAPAKKAAPVAKKAPAKKAARAGKKTPAKKAPAKKKKKATPAKKAPATKKAPAKKATAKKAPAKKPGAARKK